MDLFNLVLSKKFGGGSGGGSDTAASESVKSMCEQDRIVLSGDSVEYVKKDAFRDEDKLVRIDLKNAKRIETGAFCYCNELTHANIPAVKSIESDVGRVGAFEKCVKLVDMNLPLAEHIGGRAFFGCENLATIDLPSAKILDMDAFAYCTALKQVYLPVCESICDGAFGSCESLTKLDLPCVTSIGAMAFADCIELSAMIIRTTETVCSIDLTAVVGTKIATAEYAPTGEGFIYVPDSLFEDYVAQSVLQSVALGLDDATADYIARAVLRKIEDYPEICG